MHNTTLTPQTPHKRSSKRRTVKVTVWVKPELKAEIARLAEKDGLSLSKTAGAFLAEAIRQKLHIQHAVLLQPIIEQAIRKQMRGIATRLALLDVRVAVDSGQTRSIVTNILGRMPGMTQAVLEKILDESFTSAKRNITRRAPELVALIETVEQWMLGEGEGQRRG